MLSKKEQAIIKVEAQLLIVMLGEGSLRLSIIMLHHDKEVVHVVAMLLKRREIALLETKVVLLVTRASMAVMVAVPVSAF